MKMSRDITWTSPLTVPIIAYLDWLSKPTTEKKILDNNINIRWYSIIESTESTKSRLGPHAKFNAKSSWAVNNNDKNMGASVVVGRGMRNISLVSILNKSAAICHDPLRPIKVGPIRRWANANNFRSDRTQNKVNSTTSNALSNIASDM